MGMAVGVDYSLFYLRREREERARGRSFAEALRIAAGTSGQADRGLWPHRDDRLAGLFLTGIDQFTSIALGTIAVVGIAVAGSLTVLPALLSWLGHRADRGRIPFLGRSRAAARPSRMWAALVRRVVAHPAIWGVTAAVALLALAAPAARDAAGRASRRRAARPGRPADLGRDPAGLPAGAVARRGRGDRPGCHRAASAGRGRRAAGARGDRRLYPRAGDRYCGRRPGEPRPGHRRPAGRQRLGHGVRPGAAGPARPDPAGHAGPGARDQLRGSRRTASTYDFIHQLHDRTPVVLALVAVLAFVLLMIAFRSVAISLVSILLNLLSAGAAYGLITLIFQDGRLQGLLGYTSFGGIIAWVPLFMFVFLFGISMDYHVFILSRIRELWSRGATASDAVVGGIASSAGVVTSAALIMVAVFSIFATLPLVDLKILGIGTAAAVLIDATVVRGILVPAALALLGERAWRGRRSRA